MNEKSALRKKIQECRDSLPIEKRARASEIITGKLLRLKDYINAGTVLLFYPFRSEVDAVPVIKKSLENKKKVVLPGVEGKNLRLYYVEDISMQLRPGAYNIMEPDSSTCRPADIRDIDIAIIPGLCFDKKMNRLGYGGGYYDKLIPLLRPGVKIVALCFEIQVLNLIPADKYDQKVNMVITERKIYSL